MATVKFLIQSKKSNAPIYIYFSAGRGQLFKRKTRETVNPEFWNAKKGTVKNPNKSALSKIDFQHLSELSETLPKIESFIYNQYNKRTDFEEINGDWLDEVISAFYNGGRKIQKLDFLLNYLEYYKTDVLPYRTHRGKRVGNSTITKVNGVINTLNEFVKKENPKMKVSDYDHTISNKLEKFLKNRGMGTGTIGRFVKFPKTIINHAKTLGIEISDTLDQIKGYTTETPTIFITEKELKEIQSITFLSTNWETAKDWLVIGFYTGQRASDLLRMNKKMIVNENGNDFIYLRQKKTSKLVKIPLSKKVKEVLAKRKGNFPPSFSDNMESAKTTFNGYLREITKLANIDRLEYGKKFDKSKKSYVYGNYPLYDIISSHVCRRSFATHHYITVPTPIIMSITGHKTEKEFLKYIGKDYNDHSEEMLKYWTNQTENETAEPQQNTKTAN